MRTTELIATAVFIYAICLSAVSAAEYSKEFSECMDRVDYSAMKNTQWGRCADQEIKVQDATLNNEYNNLRRALNREQKDALLKGQRAWLKYRDDWCSFQNVADVAPGNFVNQKLCILDVTAEHIKNIKSSY